MKKTILVLLIISLLVGIAIFAIKRKRNALAEAKPIGNRPIPVSVELVKYGDFISEKRYVGIIEPLNTADISSRITAEITKIFCREGKFVKKGELLIKLDNRSLIQSISVLKAKAEGIKTQLAANNVNIKSLINSVSYWQKQVERDKRLFNKKIIPAKQLELSEEKLNEIKGQLDIARQKNRTFEAELNAVQGDIELAKTRLSYADITAPFDGVVCDVPVDPGDLASPGKKLMEIENQHKLKVSVQLPQVDMKYVHMGDELRLHCKNINGNAKIIKIYPAIGDNRMVKIEALLPEGKQKKFVSGQYVKVFLTVRRIKNILIVPSSSINIDNQQGTEKYLFIVKKGVLNKVKIKIVADNGIEAAVTGFLQPGCKVVVSAYLGWAKLANGLAAKVVD